MFPYVNFHITPGFKAVITSTSTYCGLVQIDLQYLQFLLMSKHLLFWKLVLSHYMYNENSVQSVTLLQRELHVYQTNVSQLLYIHTQTDFVRVFVRLGKNLPYLPNLEYHYHTCSYLCNTSNFLHCKASCLWNASNFSIVKLAYSSLWNASNFLHCRQEMASDHSSLVLWLVKPALQFAVVHAQFQHLAWCTGV